MICLSHLGSDSTLVDVNDFTVAHQTKHIDIILGRTFALLTQNVKTNNAEREKVIISQIGKSGCT